jgi:hypothetical protein
MGKVDFLELFHQEVPYRETYWLFNHPTLGGAQDEEAWRRHSGLKWGL